MARVAVELTNFTGGELSPRLDGRNDIAKYNSGCKTLENMIVYPHGSASRRSGTQFVAEVKDSTKKTRLISFEFSTVQTYILEFGDQYIRFYKDNGVILDGGSPYEISSPYLEAELFDIKFAQSADTMYICHPNHNPRKLTRTGHTNWTLTNEVIINGPFMDHNIETTTLTPSHKTVGATSTVTASSTTGINSNQGFLSTDVGRLLHITDGHLKITSVTSTTVVVGTVIVDLGITTPVTDFALGSFSDTTGYPACVTFFEQRLVFAGTTAQPQTLFFSRSADYENFDDQYHETVADDDAIVYTIASNQVNAIRFLTATRTLIIGTAGGEFAVNGAGVGEAITPTNILINKQSNHGAANVDGIAVGNATLFLQRAKRKIRELAYNFDVDGYVAPDLTILAEHVTESGITQMAYQEEPNSIVWCVRTDGQLLGFTYQREQQVTAWHRHIFGGSFGSGNAVCESVEVLPTDNSEYQVWVIVKRTIDGATKRYVEYLHNQDFDETDDTSFNYLDSQLAYNGSATTTISGLDHLEGEEVSILADGATHPNKTVSSGAITLDRSSTKVKVGLPYVSLLQTMRIDAGAQNGTSQSKTKRIYEITARLYESIGIEIGPDLDNMERIPFRSSANLMDSGVNVFTGDKDIEFRGNYETDGFIFVRQNQPLPLTILSLYPKLQTNDG
ncbi:tail tubular protein B [Pelagibacter phage Greip EXVC021P]|nr:tail tubular protein B [Pelagibacter phage Greip EXVC021P]